jgi:hypothetical protein
MTTTLFRARQFAVQVSLPAVGRKRMIFTCSLASAGTTLWLAAPAYLPGADVSAVMVLAGIGLPWSVGWVTLLLMERRILRDLAADPNRGQDWTVPR